MRLQVNVNDKMLEKIDRYAESMSLSRSSFCASLIGQGIMNLDKAYGIVDKMVNQFGMELSEEQLQQLGKDMLEG